MKITSLLVFLALGITTATSFGQWGAPAAGSGLSGAPTMPAPPTPPTPPPGMDGGAYGGMSPTLSAPTMGSPYAGPTMADPYANYNGYQQPAQTNSWGSTVQQSMGGNGSSILNYQYAEAFYRYVSPKEDKYNGSHGLGVALVMPLPTIFFLKGTFAWTSGSGEKTAKAAANADYELSTITIGGGAYMPITQKLHFVGEVGLVYANFQADGVNASYTDGGIYVRPSIRYQVVDWMELQAGVTVSSTDDYDSKVFDVLGYFRVFPMLDLNIGADFGDVTRGFRAGARLRW
ncbi:hypothetical protein [Brevifollis gellanilyticus]|uniref:Outer membrane protein beta-barrel domain-containing protein n=1 Tax=Brevifollis gellanilyticus TaxID=748831 RepID=A0A512MB11_9BACT|nr:hypothetical protein [Brevifollis gellanilyticus]GEP43926.1 hypothetical protein BGE01nite_32170 [Brevifollis gellanilyticus]